MPKHTHTHTNPLHEVERCILHAGGVAESLSNHNEIEQPLQFAFAAIADLLRDAYTELADYHKQQYAQTSHKGGEL